jgi:hypothetical protein
MTFVRYSAELEQPRRDEDQVVKKIADILHGNNELAFKKYRHGIRDAHAKSHGILRGDLIVYDNLPEPYRQGLFAAPGTYPIIARISSTAGAIRSDQIRGVHGLGIKVLGVHGRPRALADDDASTQDFILVTHREFPFRDAHAYLKVGMPTAQLLARMPDPALKFVTDLLGSTQEVLKRLGQSLPMALAVFTPPNTHVLGMTFFSSSPLRHGDHVAKVCVTPLSESVKGLKDQPLPPDAGRDAYRAMVAEFFRTNVAEYELQVQLCTDPAAMPIEDATVEWPERDSPYVGVAKLTFPVQNTDTPQRWAYGDDVLSFNSWRALEAHRPLGSINRLKKLVYEASSDYRHRVNNVPRMEPKDVADLPD